MTRLSFVCPKCGVRLVAAPGAAKSIRCGQCGAAFSSSAAVPAATKSPSATAGVCVLIAVGLVISLQPVTLLTGSTMVWIGVAIVGGGMALAFFLRAHGWVRVVAAIVLALALANALSVENQLSDRRQQFGRTLGR